MQIEARVFVISIAVNCGTTWIFKAAREYLFV